MRNKDIETKQVLRILSIIFLCAPLMYAPIVAAQTLQTNQTIASKLVSTASNRLPVASTTVAATVLTVQPNPQNAGNNKPLFLCPTGSAALIYPVTTYSGKNLCPSSTTRIIYVSSSGNDANSGLSPNQPIRSPSAAIDRLNSSAQAQWILFKRGDVFNQGFNINGDANWNMTDSKPLVISSYGEGTVRPMFRVNDGMGLVNNARANFKNIIISGLHFKAMVGMGVNAVRVFSGGKDIVFDDNRFEGYANAINIITYPNTPTPLTERLAIRNNVFLNAASGPGPGGHSSSIYAHLVKDMIIENNLFDFGGYVGSRDTGINDRIVGCQPATGNPIIPLDYLTSCPIGQSPIYADTQATIFNHHMYLQVASYPAIVRNNIVSRASAHGLQARSGALVEGNIFSRNPLAILVDSSILDTTHSYTSRITKNIILEGVDLNSSTPRGFGVIHNSAYATVMQDNIIANTMNGLLRYNKNALTINCGAREGAGQAMSPCSSKINNNIIYNWGDGSSGLPLTLSLDLTQSNYRGIEVSQNILLAEGSESNQTVLQFSNNSPETAGNRVTFSKNLYGAEGDRPTNVILNETPYRATSTQNWINPQTGYDRNGTQTPNDIFADPCRTIETYYDDVVLRNLNNNNCAIMHDNQLYDQFMSAAASAKNRLAPDNRFNADAVSNYIRRGFAPANFQ